MIVPHTPDELRIALLTWIEFGREARRPIADRLAERLPGLKPSERDTALDVAHHVVNVAERLVREFRAGTRSEGTITGALLETFPWLGADAAPVRSPDALPATDLSSRVRGFAYYLVMK